jgi:hypothetical protein
MPDELNIRSQETAETGESADRVAAQKLDDATYEPRALVEQSGDYKQAETVQASFMKLMNTAAVSAGEGAAQPSEEVSGTAGRTGSAENLVPAEVDSSSQSSTSLARQKSDGLSSAGTEVPAAAGNASTGSIKGSEAKGTADAAGNGARNVSEAEERTGGAEIDGSAGGEAAAESAANEAGVSAGEYAGMETGGPGTAASGDTFQETVSSDSADSDGVLEVEVTDPAGSESGPVESQGIEGDGENPEVGSYDGSISVEVTDPAGSENGPVEAQGIEGDGENPEVGSYDGSIEVEVTNPDFLSAEGMPTESAESGEEAGATVGGDSEGGYVGGIDEPGGIGVRPGGGPWSRGRRRESRSRFV